MQRVVECAYEQARTKSSDLPNAERSSSWVRELAMQLGFRCRLPSPQPSIISFCRSDYGNRRDFRMNELLFDILVAEIVEIKSVNGAVLKALSKAHWIVESELKRTDSRDILIDMNKLVVGKARNKLLVISAGTPLVDWARRTMEILFPPGEANVFLVTIPHPEDWYSTKPTTRPTCELISASTP